MDAMTQTLHSRSVSEMRTLVRDISDFLSGPVHTMDAGVQSLWQHYCECCQHVNQRLDFCSQLLDRGEWLEAARQTEMEPRVLECAGILDFEYRSTWEQICCENGWARYVPVSLAACRRLSEACENRQRLQPLLKSHVRLALSRAPLSRRLPVMRELARKDTLSTFWRDEILAMERLRGPELTKEARAAVVAGDVTKLTALVEEFRSSPWLLKFPESARKSFDEAEQHIIRLQQLPELSDRLLQCFRGRDVAGGAVAFADWCRLWERVRAFRNPILNELDIRQETRAALTWASHLPAAEEPPPMAGKTVRHRYRSGRVADDVASAPHAEVAMVADCETSGEFSASEDVDFDPYVQRLKLSKRTLILVACLGAGITSLAYALILVFQAV
jgi:hypothetical protein